MFGITGIAAPPPVSPSTVVGTRTPVDKTEESSVLKDAAPPAEEEKSIVSVKLVSYAAEKRVGVIKESRGILGLCLQESNELVDSVQKVIKRGLPREEADQIRAKLEAAGGVVELS
jgi:ribosomal protein L7/L12